MIQLLCMFFPSVIALKIFERVRKKPLSGREYVFYYVVFTLFVNTCVFLLLSLHLGGSAVLSSTSFTLNLALVYLLLSLVFSFAGAYGLGYGQKNISFRFFTTQRVQKKSHLFSKTLKYFSGTLLLVSAAFAFYGINWVQSTFAGLTFDELMFHLAVPLEGSESGMILSFIKSVLAPSIIFALVILGVVLIIPTHRALIMKLRVKSWQKNLPVSAPFHFFKRFFAVFSAVVFVLSACRAIILLDVGQISDYFFSESTFIEENYVSPGSVNLTFPEEKRNLIYIFMESMETTYLPIELGGSQEENLIPELTEIMTENTHFTGANTFGGWIGAPGTGWTMAAMMANSAGAPLKLPIQRDRSSFLPGLITIGDILAKEGYNQTLLLGSDAKFGGREQFYKEHGNFRILDLYTARDDGIVPEDYYAWWGYEDLHLYEYAKKELAFLSGEDEPFNLTMLTVDTHHIAGYVCSLCRNNHEEQYANVISCASRQLADFLNWLKEQPYYEDTAIVIVGDHLSMDAEYFGRLNLVNDRSVVNVFINSSVSTKNTTTRVFSSYDFFPTTLASMGVEIEGDRLALGVNLFSEEKTIFERYGFDKTKEELSKRSAFYNQMFLYQ